MYIFSFNIYIAPGKNHKYRGQLGLGKEIAAGGDHTLFLTLSGLVYCCGANKFGQLGVNRVDEKGIQTDFISFTLFSSRHLSCFDEL
uniref:Uncharacterized protein n=1 Tax=Cyprinodon variegatus TaxID=28743 RepID=A0A3Q2DVH2_CYPVA